ncbi:DUF4326 domain-containing protein [Roseomonas sp. NAR14]|uniref:DUF4326 domain-containing protein n=1 Tax=Roseomonas acroporae TaxID=2937791 RepID=A0A9X1YFJ3_9PROT|nr:DUF4326 domain-containing protein [Roseomonas acroporae]MCK8787943.1 DUF4326 domain-containing protein [Roseomonas acroporae]
MRVTVHNLRYEAMRPGDVRIDRRTEFGNEFVLGRDGTRPEVIAKFEMAERARLADPVSGPDRRAKVRAMRGHRLFCWCPPLACHGEVYVKLAAELVETGEVGEGNRAPDDGYVWRSGKRETPKVGEWEKGAKAVPHRPGRRKGPSAGASRAPRALAPARPDAGPGRCSERRKENTDGSAPPSGRRSPGSP